ncbi:MAG: carboxypeptidase regulatory-like domain-containing protein [Candidatus Dormibacterales bacterium]
MVKGGQAPRRRRRLAGSVGGACRRSLALFASGAILAGGVHAYPGHAVTASAAQPQPHVMVIVEENREYGDVIGSPDAPYINSLVQTYTSASSWYAVQHNSTTEYLALLSGSTWGAGSGTTFPLPPSDLTLVDELQGAGISWKAYIENMPEACYVGQGSTPYNKSHNPFVYFDSIVGDASQCDNVVPYSPGLMNSDLNSASPPDFVWVTPNDCDNMHGDTNPGSPCAADTTAQLTTAGDTWLNDNLPTVLSSSWFTVGGTVIITWDEGTSKAGFNGGDGGQIPTLVISSKGSGQYAVGGDHYGTLKGIEEAFGVGLLGNSAGTGNGDLEPAFDPGGLTGRVTDGQTGAALGGVTVDCSCPAAPQTTSTDGDYTFPGLPPGPSYRLTFSDPGYATHTRDGIAVSPGLTATVDATMLPPGAISGRVTDALTGSPIGGAAVTCTCQGGGVTGDAGGGYSFTQVDPGTYTVSASTTGYQAASAQVVVSPGVTTAQDLQLSPGHALTVSPAQGPPGGGTPVTITGTGFQAGATVTFGSDVPSAVNVVTPTTLTATTPPGTGLVSVAVTEPGGAVTIQPDAYTYTTGAPCSAAGAAASPGPPDRGRPWPGGSDALGVSAGATNAYFAEGYTGPNFDEYITVENAGPAQPLCVDYLLQSGAVITRVYQLPGQSRTTINVNHDVGAGQNVSAHLYASNPFVAERPMYFDYGGTIKGGDDVTGAQQLGTDFLFAEGYTGPGFDEYLTLLNPDPTQAAQVTITYYFSGGGTTNVPWTVPAHSRSTVHVNDRAQAGPGQQVSAEVKSANGVPFLAERPMYFDYEGKWTGGDVVVGSTHPSTALDLAEGYVAPNFDEYLTILNANPSPADVTLTYEVQGGAPKVVTITVAPQSRATHLVNQDFAAPTSLAVHITSDQPVVVERPMYFDYGSGWKGGHDAVAAEESVLGASFDLAEGYVAPNFVEYLTVLNDTSASAQVTLTYLLVGGGTKQVSMTVPANSRATHMVNSDFPGRAVEESVHISSNVPVLVERPMYFAY